MKVSEYEDCILVQVQDLHLPLQTRSTDALLLELSILRRLGTYREEMQVCILALADNVCVVSQDVNGLLNGSFDGISHMGICGIQ